MNAILKILVYRPGWIIWIFRVVFSLNIIIPALVFETNLYPSNVLIVTFFCYWLDVCHLTWISIILMALILFINLQHLFHPTWYNR